MSDEALNQRRRNVAAAVSAGTLMRLRSDRESLVIKLLAWQSRFESGTRPSERALARQLGVWPSYVHKLLEKAHSEGMDVLVQHGKHVTLDDLAVARRFTARIKEQQPDLLTASRRLYGVESSASQEPRWMTTEESTEQTRREVAEWKRKNLWRTDTRSRIRVPIPG